jgi:hydrogenase maturation factor
VDRERIPVLREGRMLCEAFGLDPLGTIASGSLLLAVDPADAPDVTAACRDAGIDCAQIGRVTEASQGVTLATGGHPRPMPTFPQDQITRIFSEG